MTRPRHDAAEGEVARRQGAAFTPHGRIAVTRRRGLAPVRRPGVALLSALVTIILLALIAAGAMHLGRGDFQRSRDERVMRQAGNAADAGAYDLLRRWPLVPHEALPVGAVLGPDTVQLAGGTAVARAVRASRTTWWVTSAGRAGDSLARTLARRTVAVALRLAIPDIPVNAALVVRDSVAVAGSARVVGSDTVPAALAAHCPVPAAGPAPTPSAAIAMPDTTRLCDGTCGAGSVSGRITGSPPLLTDSSAALPARFRAFGPEHWATLTRHAAIVLPPGSVVTPAPAVSGASCDRARADNWGDPSGSGPCATYAPLIWATGDLRLQGGAGQGVLLVDGDLVLDAGARFSGVVITLDDVVSTGLGGTLLGAVLAADVRVAAGDYSRLDGSTLIQRSSCAAALALEWSARLVPVSQRAWNPLR